ncbi:MAG: HIT domain-containing protein [candidate division Zixibacteria bacterium]|nr:HIT domain-containing protein [candidate division Zixibacteria bacterium]
MQKIWAPWREAFILGKKPKGCIFCLRKKSPQDKQNLILFRGKTAFVILNLYPYNPGHVMVVPNRHIGSLDRLTEPEQKELLGLAGKSVNALKRAFRPQGFNLGMNLERVAGAGVLGHIHIHVVPRWNGDTNFMPLVADTKVVSSSLSRTYLELKKAFR